MNSFGHTGAPTKNRTCVVTGVLVLSWLFWHHTHRRRIGRIDFFRK